MFVFKKYDRQNYVWSFMTKYLRFLGKFMSWSGETPQVILAMYLPPLEFDECYSHHVLDMIM